MQLGFVEFYSFVSGQAQKRIRKAAEVLSSAQAKPWPGKRQPLPQASNLKTKKKPVRRGFRRCQAAKSARQLWVFGLLCFEDLGLRVSGGSGYKCYGWDCTPSPAHRR